MAPQAVRGLRAFAGEATYESFLEYESTNGIADLVFGEFDWQAVAVRSEGPLARAFVDRAEAAVLLSLDEVEPRRTSAVAQLSGLAESTAGAKLAALTTEGAVTRPERGNWLLAGPLPSRLAAAAAFELKLANWKRALDQAARYRAFAERTAVVLSDRHAPAACRHLDAFAFNRVGLISLSAWGETHVLVDSPPLPAYDRVARFVAGERLWMQRPSLATAA